MNQPNSAALQLKADLAELRDIVTARTVGIEPDEIGSTTAVVDSLELTHEPGKFHVHLVDEDQDEPEYSPVPGSSEMHLVFDDTLEVIGASILVLNGNGGGFERHISQRALGGFVTGVLAGVVSELAVINQ